LGTPPEVQRGFLGLFVSDSWRLSPSLTLTGGLRWELQFPFEPDLDTYARLQDWQMVYGLTGRTTCSSRTDERKSRPGPVQER